MKKVHTSLLKMFHFINFIVNVLLLRIKGLFQRIFKLSRWIKMKIRYFVLQIILQIPSIFLNISVLVPNEPVFRGYTNRCHDIKCEKTHLSIRRREAWTNAPPRPPIYHICTNNLQISVMYHYYPKDVF